MSQLRAASPWSLPVRLIGFLGWYLWQFVLTSLQVVALILTPGRQPKPGIVRMGIEGLSDTEVTVLVVLITITPDTLVIAVDRDKDILFVHGMFVDGDSEGFRKSLGQTRDRLLFGVRARPEAERKRGVLA